MCLLGFLDRAWGLSVEEFRAWPCLGRESTGIRRWVGCGKGGEQSFALAKTAVLNTLLGLVTASELVCWGALASACFCNAD